MPTASGDLDDPDVPRTEGRLVSVLNELEAAWRRCGAPIADALAPGLSSDEIDALTMSAELTVPPGLKLWWGWHNGIDPSCGDPAASDTGMAYNLISLQQALEIRAMLLDVCGEPYNEETADVYWRASWLPFAGPGKDLLFVDTSDTRATPVRELNWAWEEFLTVRADTLTEVAEAWLHVVTRGWVFWVPDAGAWDMRPDLPLYLRMSSLI